MQKNRRRFKSVSRILFPETRAAIICLGSGLLRNSSGLPEGHQSEQLWSGRSRIPFYLTLLQVGLALIPTIAGTPKRDLRYYYRSGRLLPCLFTLIPKYSGRYFFCGAFRDCRLAPNSPRALPGTLFYGVRTFLYSRKHSLSSNCPTWIIYSSSTLIIL